ncbi:MAG: TetR/AcrR family transcriptional regulator [Firmicutes bacterium]|nr:TetR/AcrR family transcriptional regulator [Bacillota bacterium]
MTDKFLRLEEDKRQRIITAALWEFARQGYKDAKTDNIVEEASISKGLLFHYFGTKKKLFLFLFDYALEIFEELAGQISMHEDIFERLRQNNALKLDYYRRYPDLMNFGASVWIKGAAELQEELFPRMEPMNRKIYASLYEGLDLSRFRDDVDPKVAINIILMTMEGLSNKIIADYQKQYRDVPIEGLESSFAKYITEFEKHLEVLKKTLYKEGRQGN